MEYTAVFGGTFNPFHIGHYEMLGALCKCDSIKKVLVVPDRIPPHKECDFLASDGERAEMCRLACTDFAKAELCTLELERDGRSYTSDTIKDLKRLYPDDKFAIVCGGDMLATLDTWHNWRYIIENVSIFVFERGDVPDFQKHLTRMRGFGADITVFNDPITVISSTLLRKRPIRTMLNESVFKFILEKGVYMDKKIPEYAEYKGLLKSRLKEKRYYHSLAVADEAYRLAEKYGADSGKAYLAGLLHDITKNSDADEHLNIFNTFGIILSDIEKGSEKLWHAISGAAYIKYILNIDDAEIYDAIRYHTTARGNISLLSKIIYLADFTSADRDYEDVDVIRALVDKSLDDAYFYALSYTVKELVERGNAIHPDTIAAYNETALKKSDEKNGK